MRFAYVEDEPEVQRQTLSWLRYERHEVTVFDNVIDALNYLRINEPEVLLCDYRLDGGPNGLALAGQVRQLYPACTIVMVSNYAEKPEFEQAFGLGVDDFVSRPIDFPVLSDRIWKAVQRRRVLVPPPRPTTLVSGPLVVEAETRSVALDGEPLPLTPSQYEILQYMVTRPGQPVSFSDLGAHLWGERLDRKVARKRLKPHIASLREKLEKRITRPLIINLRGYGYRWAPYDPNEASSGEGDSGA